MVGTLGREMGFKVARCPPSTMNAVLPTALQLNCTNMTLVCMLLRCTMQHSLYVLTHHCCYHSQGHWLEADLKKCCKCLKVL